MSKRPVKRFIKSTGRFAVISVILIVGFILPLLSVGSSYADPIKLLHRLLQQSTDLTGATSVHTFRWKYPDTELLGAIEFDYCTNPYANLSCDAPDGIDVSGATLTNQVGETGFTILSQTTSQIILTRTPFVVNPALDNLYEFSNVINPTTAGQYAVRVKTYTSADTSGLVNDDCDIAFSTVGPITVNAEVPPFLFFCVSEFITDYCQSSGRTFFDFGDFDTTQTNTAQTQMQIATNAQNGYTITMGGNTMTSSNHIIDALSVPTASSVGTSQFGVNLRANTSPAIGQDEQGIGIGTISPDYDTPDLFKYGKDDVLASAVTGSNYNKYTVSYVVNVPPDLPAGVYNTTVTYIATASF